MNTHCHSSRVGILSMVSTMALVLAYTPASNASDTKAAPISNGASLLGGAVPGGAVISARYAVATPASGGQTVSAPVASDGSFKIAGLAPGPYRLAISSGTTAPKQTQGATFGEKVNAGLHSAGSAISQGAAKSDTKHDTAMNSVGNVRGREAAPAATPESSSAPATSAEATQKGINGINGSMPNRISMNFTVGRQTGRIDVDGAPVAVDVGTDGNLVGNVVAAQ